MPQQTFEITAPDGRVVEITGDRMPSGPELQGIFAKLPPATAPAPVSSQIDAPADSRSLVEQAGMPPIADIGVGAAKGVASTAVGLTELAHKIPGVSRLTGLTPGSFEWARAQLKPTNTAQKIGKGAEQVAEFFGPGALLKGAKTAMAVGGGGRVSNAVNAGTGLALEGASAAAVDAAQKGTTDDLASTAALSAGMGGLVQTLAKGGQGAARWLSEASEKALLKPSTRALEGQTPTAMVRNLFKYDAGGTLGQSFDKVNERIVDRVGKLKSTLAADPSAVVDLRTLGADTLKSFMNNKQAAEAMDRIQKAVTFGLNERGLKLKNGVLDLADANVAKQAVGELGAWIKGVKGQTADDASDVLEKVANRFYGNLKTAIEKQAKGDVAAINRELSELIPIRTAIIERIPVADRANIMSLPDVAALASGNLGISIANRLLGSGRVANAANKASKADTSKLAQQVARLTGAAQ